MHRGTLPLMLALVASAAVAGDDRERIIRLVEEGKVLPLDRVLAVARQDRPGRLLEAELEEEEGRPVYELEVLDGEGRVWELHYDAATGRAIDQHEE